MPIIIAIVLCLLFMGFYMAGISGLFSNDTDEQKIIGGKIGMIAGILLFLTSHWLMVATSNWPNEEVELPVLVENDTAYVQMQTYEEVLENKSANEGKLVAPDKEKMVNINKETGKQYKTNDKIKVKVFKPRAFGLSGWLKYSIQGE